MDATLQPFTNFLSDLEIGDIIDYYDLGNFGQTKVKHARISYIDKDNHDLKIKVGGKEIYINPRKGFSKVFVSQIVCTNLTELGFVQVESKPAYGNTLSKWVLEKQDKIWILSHDEKKMTWVLELKIKGKNETEPIILMDNLIYIHQVQHCVKTGTI